jgi:outer membrane protein OmpA-like peptidoglycan-associated protein
MALLNFSDVTKMNINSGEISKTSLGLNLGADYMLSNNWTIFANTLALFADKNNNFYFNIGLSYKFNCSNCSDKSNVIWNDFENQNNENEQKQIKDLRNDIYNKNEQLQNINNKSKKLENELARKNKELEEAAKREKELRDMLQKYQAEIVNEQQAKKIRETQIMEIRLDEKPTFLFAKAKLTNNGRKSLKEVAKEINKYPTSDILIEGHTDNIGSDKYNDNLSLRRAAAIAEVLKRDYKVKNKIGIIGKGKRVPIYSNKTKAGRAKNRRVEIIVGAPEQ